MYNYSMFYTLAGVLIRIFSNSYLNVFQKILSDKGQKSSVINFYTYLGLSILGLFFVSKIDFFAELIKYTLLTGFCGAFGNYFIIKALSIGELSSLAPVNSYKPLVALVFGIIFLNEIPSLYSIPGIILILSGTYFVLGKAQGNSKAVFYRFIALIFSGLEAVFIKKMILLSGTGSAFVLWALAGLIFSFAFLLFSKPKFKPVSLKYQIFLILAVGIMQYSTNFVFARMDVACALALFQLSTLLSVFLGIKIFDEKNLKQKLAGSLIMIAGAVILILC